jgi:hypothetical protein
VVTASSCMIGVNRRRFPKQMFPLLELFAGREGSIALHPIVLWDSAATRVAKSCAISPTQARVMGVLSLVTWTLTILVPVEYAWPVLRAPCGAEGSSE